MNRDVFSFKSISKDYDCLRKKKLPFKYPLLDKKSIYLIICVFLKRLRLAVISFENCKKCQEVWDTVICAGSYDALVTSRG